jgi:thymidylate synthase
MIVCTDELQIIRALHDHGSVVETPTWHALDVQGTPQGSMWEAQDISLVMQLPRTKEELDFMCGERLSRPWAENQFQERISGQPLNPGETFKEWPYYQGNVEQHKAQGQFSHTYMERYWPKYPYDPDGFDKSLKVPPRRGIRFKYGDLSDVINLLAKQPTTRQAYLPVWFPEDTGAVHGERVPCSLGYLFLMREGKLNITYYIRSCDFFRHLHDDVYMTGRLCQWVLEELQVGDDAPAEGVWDNVVPGTLTMHIGSLHIFSAELPRLRKELNEKASAGNQPLVTKELHA